MIEILLTMLTAQPLAAINLPHYETKARISRRSGKSVVTTAAAASAVRKDPEKKPTK